MRFSRFLVIIFIVTLNIHNVQAQELLFNGAPFSSGILETIYTENSSKVYCKIYFDNYGERYSIDLKRNQESENSFQSIIRIDDFWFYIQHSKKEVLKVPVKELVKPYDTTKLIFLQDTTFLGYNANYYTGNNDSIVAIYYFDLLLFVNDLYNNINYEVVKVSENESFPEYVFFLPRGFTMTEMNYNFSK
jgi:hypothetical protein